MKKFLFRVAVASGVLLSSSLVSAKATIGAIDKITVESNYFKLNLVGSPDMCTTAINKADGSFIVGQNGFSADAIKMAHAMAIAAKLAGRNVIVYTSENSTSTCIVSNFTLQ